MYFYFMFNLLNLVERTSVNERKRSKFKEAQLLVKYLALRHRHTPPFLCNDTWSDPRAQIATGNVTFVIP